MLSRRPALAAAVLALTLTACNDDGRTLAPAPTVAVSRATTSSSAGAPEAVGMTLRSPAFEDGGVLDASFTCDGVDVPPPLEIVGVPDAAAELAIVMTDADAGEYVHWVLTALPPTVTRLESGVIPPQARAALTQSGVEGWEGPCPPPGDDPHAYRFVVHALPEPVGLAPRLPGRDAIALIEQASIASDALVGFYQRPGG